MTRDELKKELTEWQPEVNLVEDEDTQRRLVGKLDLANSKIKYEITDWELNNIYNSTNIMNEAINMFFDEVEKVQNESK